MAVKKQLLEICSLLASENQAQDFKFGSKDLNQLSRLIGPILDDVILQLHLTLKILLADGLINDSTLLIIRYAEGK